MSQSGESNKPVLSCCSLACSVDVSARWWMFECVWRNERILSAVTRAWPDTLTLGRPQRLLCMNCGECGSLCVWARVRALHRKTRELRCPTRGARSPRGNTATTAVFMRTNSDVLWIKTTSWLTGKLTTIVISVNLDKNWTKMPFCLFVFLYFAQRWTIVVMFACQYKV